MELSTKLKREKELKKKRKTEYDVKLFNAVEYNFSSSSAEEKIDHREEMKLCL